jgi:hypothetical protein
MASKETRPPLGPADARYAGLGPCGWHRLEWPSQTREGVTHRTYVHETLAEVRCSCEGFAHRGECKHSRAALDTLAHHLAEPPPADPGGARACRPCWHCPTRAYCAEHGCRYEFAASAADPGGAVGEPPELAGLAECEDAARDERKRRYTESMANLYGG